MLGGNLMDRMNSFSGLQPAASFLDPSKSFDYIGLLEESNADVAPVTAVGDGEDFLEVKEMQGYRHSIGREIAHWILVICSGFLALLFIRWFERRYLPYRYRRVHLHEAEYVLVDGKHSGYEWIRVERLSASSADHASSNAAATTTSKRQPIAVKPIGDSNNLSSPLLHSHSSTQVAAAAAAAPSTSNDDVDAIPLPQRMIIFRHTRFVYDIASQSFKRLAYPSSMPAAGMTRLDRIVTKGLSTRRHRAHLSRYGFNELPVAVPPILQLLKDEILHPFFVFQLYSVILWCFEGYFIFAGAILLIAFVSAVSALLETRRNLQQLRALAEFDVDVTVIRDGLVKTVSSKHLVPGDVVEITNQLTLPCDIVLLQGQAILNESMLTGESVPVVKYPADLSPPSFQPASLSLMPAGAGSSSLSSRSARDDDDKDDGDGSDGDDNGDEDSGLGDDDRTPPRSQSRSRNNDDNSVELKGSQKRSSSGIGKDGAVMVGVGTYIDAPSSSLAYGDARDAPKRGNISMPTRVMKPIGNDQRSTLYAATKVVQLKPSIGKKQVIGMVVRTAFATQKGSLILSILFPKPSTFKFVQQSFKFTGALFMVAVCGLGLSIWQLIRLDAEVSQIITRGLDLITIVVPPALPLAMTVGANFAMQQLKKQHVFCISPPRINMAGKIKMMCFDKTGTLTSDGMEVMGVRVVSRLLGAPISHASAAGILGTVGSAGAEEWGTEASSVDAMRMPQINARDRSFPTEPVRLPLGSASVSNSVTNSVRDGAITGLGESPASDDSTMGFSPMMGQSVTATPPLASPPHLNTGTPPARGFEEKSPNAMPSRGGWRSNSFSQHFAPLTIDAQQMGPEILAAMATCHSLALLDGKFIGDPLEIKMFEAAGAQLRDQATGQYMSVCRWNDPDGKMTDAGISHQFEFQSALQRMAVIAHLLPSSTSTALTSSNHLPSSSAGVTPLPRRGPSARTGIGAAVGGGATTTPALSSRATTAHMGAIGSPLVTETTSAANGDDSHHHGGDSNLSSALRQSMSYSAGVPAARAIHAYVKGSPEMIISLSLPHTIPPDYAKVLSVYTRRGFRVIAVAFKPLASVPDVAKDLLRAEIEKDLHFLGFIVLENKLKSETAPTLVKLKAARIRCVMVSGDNPVTCVTVAQDCQMVEPKTRIFVSRLTTGDDGQYIEWRDSDDDKVLLDHRTLRPANDNGIGPYELAITGDCFRFLNDMPDAHERLSFFHKVILACQIFARMTPDQKAGLIAELQLMGMYVGMCGDGANDCGALKTAHIGVSLSEAEASIAAPFTYSRPNISCIPFILAEGRSALITCFQLFRYMAMYSMIQFIAIILIYFKGSNFGDWQFLYQDLWVVTPLVVFIANTHANPELSVKRPSGNLLSFANLTNLLTHIAICAAFQITVFFLCQQQPLYHDYTTDIDWDERPNDAYLWETTSLYYYTNFEYVILALLFAIGRPWKKHIWTNWQLIGWAAILIVSAALLLFAYNGDVFIFRDDVPLPDSWKYILALLLAGNIVLVIIYELFIFPAIVFCRKHRSASVAALSGSVFGRGGTLESGAKVYHHLRHEFEQGWYASQAAPAIAIRGARR